MSDPPGFDAQVTFCYTADLTTTARFYEDMLGLLPSLDQGRCRIYRVAPNAHLGFCTTADSRPTDGVILTLVTDDVDGWFQRLGSRGVEFEHPPKFNPDFNIYHCFLRDPNGYLIEIQRFADPGWTP